MDKGDRMNINEDITVQEFTLLGGPLHRLGCRLGLVREGTNTVRLGVVIGLLTWSVLLLLTLVGGNAYKAFSLSLIGIHVRLLVALPLFFVCEAIVAPRMAQFSRNIARSGVVPQKEVPALESEIVRLAGWKDSWLPEAVCLLLAMLVPLIGEHLHLTGSTAVNEQGLALAKKSLADLWYWFVCLPLFRFLIFRWLLHLGLWWHFLWRVSKLKLSLVPTHPDSVGGLGYLEVVQTHFTPLVLALSAVQSASFAEGFSIGTMAFESIYPALALNLVLIAALFLGPLFIFTPRLWVCRVKGWSDYMGFASKYVRGFDRKWLAADAVPDEPLLGTPDLQSLADLGNSINIVRNMRMVPLSSRLVLDLAIAALVPMLPLLLFKYPVAELAEKFFTGLIGM